VNSLVRPTCDAFGCVANLTAVEIALPYRLVSVQPALPTAIARNGTAVSLLVQLPTAGGAPPLVGSLLGGPTVRAVEVDGQSFVPTNATGQSLGFVVYPNVNASLVAPGSVFIYNVSENNTSPYFERINSVTVDPPFVLQGVFPGLPFEFNANTSQFMGLILRAPTIAGNYTLNGTFQVGVLPQNILSSMNVSFTNATPVYVQSWGIPNPVLPGEEENGSLLFFNPSNTVQVLLFRNLTGPVFFVNSTPNTSFDIEPNSSFRFYLQISAETPPGAAPLILVFRVTA
jgi:hypothetical protein